MTPARLVLFAAYFACMALLAIYGLHRLYLLLLHRRHRNETPSPPAEAPGPLPMLTVQIPIYNEIYVAGRAIDAACALDYPRDRLEIQILDDSTDGTRDLCRTKVEECRAAGHRILHLARATRAGFKAGALAEGLKVARGKFVAIFDADFVPPRDFARRILPFFADCSVGMVQARWEHLNRDQSALTRAQSIFLDGHFLIEQTARNRSGRFFNFNGTAGIWRRECIETSGGWQHDTLTEDLDLSYRAQMAGWRFLFLPDIAAPAELPAQMNAFKTQQHRWAKGSIQTAIKLLPALLRSGLPAAIKVEAFFHLTANVAYLLMVVASLLYFPVMRAREGMEWSRLLALDLPMLFLGTGSVLAFYLVSQREARSGWIATLCRLPCLMSVGIGLCVNNTQAVLEAALGRTTDFIRTPKPIRQEARSVPRRYRGSLSPLVCLEAAGAIYFGFILTYALRRGVYASLPFALLFFSGFLYSAACSLGEALHSGIREAGS
jgi:cellulose synthase/poly-beta-1,6-N-acetylglucosamine synthase-like glycosyltransferase